MEATVCTADNELSSYEMIRIQNITRNQSILDSLEIQQVSVNTDVSISPKKKTKVSRTLQGEAPSFERRTSSRLSSINNKGSLQTKNNEKESPDSNHNNGSFSENVINTGLKLGKRHFSEEECDQELMNLKGPLSTSELLEDIICIQEKQLVKLAENVDTFDWRKFAVDKWGALVGSSGISDWRVFVRSRCVVNENPGFDLVQERYCDDAWKLLIACLLMSRVSSADTKEKCIGSFFRAFPTPSNFKVARDEEVAPLIAPLGLLDSRLRGLREATHRFLLMPEFRLGLAPPLKSYGIGPFCYESYLIFCCGQGRAMAATDATLKAYCAWLRRQAPPSPPAASASA